MTAIGEVSGVQSIFARVGSIANNLEQIPAECKCRIQYLGWLSYEQVIRYIINADVLFAFYNPVVPNNLYASPNKLFEAMMCGKPLALGKHLGENAWKAYETK